MDSVVSLPPGGVWAEASGSGPGDSCCFNFSFFLASGLVLDTNAVASCPRAWEGMHVLHSQKYQVIMFHKHDISAVVNCLPQVV